MSALLCLVSEPRERLLKTPGTMRRALLNTDKPAASAGPVKLGLTCPLPAFLVLSSSEGNLFILVLGILFLQFCFSSICFLQICFFRANGPTLVYV